MPAEFQWKTCLQNFWPHCHFKKIILSWVQKFDTPCWGGGEGVRGNSSLRSTNSRAVAEGDGPKVTEPNLRFSAVFCENLRFSAKNLRFSAVSCALQMLESRRKGESTKICGFLRKSAFGVFSVTLVPSPYALPDLGGALSILPEMVLATLLPNSREQLQPSTVFLGSGCGTVGKCAGPKWPKMVQTTILVKVPYPEPEISIRETKMDHNGTFWSILA